MTSRGRIVWSGYLIVFTAMTAFAGATYRLGEQRYAIYHAGIDDGVFLQVLTSAYHGFHSTVEGINHLAVHFSPILFLLAPIVMATHSALALIAVQSIAGAATAYPLFLIARRRMPIVLAAASAAVVLLYPPLVGIMTGDFHEHALTPALIMWTIWSVDTKRAWATTLFGLLALGIKEDVSVTFALDGFAAACWFHRRRDYRRAHLSLGLGIGGAITFGSYFFVVLPLVQAPAHYWSFHFYVPNGATSSPAGFVGFADPIRLRYLIAAFVPLCFIPLLTPAVLLCAPGLLEVLASREAITMNMGTHYAAIWVPFMLVAFALASHA